MTTHLKLLALRRQQLVTRCALQRESLAIQKIRLQHSLTILDTGMRILERVRSNPGLILALLGGAVVLAPRRLLSMLKTGLVVSRGWRLLAPLLSSFFSARSGNRRR